ncbi:MAG: class I SAM-dependent methyltransferase [Pseudomonadota bacterium]
MTAATLTARAQAKTPPTRDAAFWDRIAEKYARDPISDMAGYLATLERTKSYLGPDMNVLEIGAGTSSTALALAPLVARYHATDISPEMVRIGRGRAAEAGTDLEISVAGPDDPALRSGSHDAVLAFNFVHLVADVERTLGHVREILRPGGLFISKTALLAETGPARHAMLRVALPVMKLFGKAPGHVQFLRGEGLLAAIRWAGFEIVEEAQDGAAFPRHYIVARKPG